MARNSFLESHQCHHDHSQFRRSRSAPCLGEHLTDVGQDIIARSLHAQELHFSPVEALLGNRMRQWSIWHMSICNQLRDTPIPHMVFSYEAYRTVAEPRKFSKYDGLEMGMEMFSDATTFRTVTMLETSWEYLPVTSHVNPPDQGPLKIDLAQVKYFVNPRRLLNLEDAQLGPIYVVLARESNGNMQLYYHWWCKREFGNSHCDGSCGNLHLSRGGCTLCFFPYQSAAIQALVPNGLNFSS